MQDWYVTLHWLDVALATAIVTGIGCCFGVVAVFCAAAWIDYRGKR